MSEWFVYQPSGQHAGPVSADSLARGVLEGKVPRDAHVARVGATSWQLVTNIPEVASVLASHVAPTVPSPRTIPPAPPPRTTLPPAAQGIGGYGVPRAEVAPLGISSTMPSKGGVGPRRPEPEPQGSIVLPIVVLVACVLVSMIVSLVGLIAVHPTAAIKLGTTPVLLGAAAFCTLVLPPKNAALRFVGAIVLMAAMVMVGTSAVAALPQLLNLLLTALMLRFATDDRAAAARTAYMLAWGLVPGTAVIAWSADAFVLR